MLLLFYIILKLHVKLRCEILHLIYSFHISQKQAQSYQTQVDGKTQSMEDNSCEIPRLICEPDPSCETNERDEFIIAKLKSAVSEIALSRNKLQDENQKLLQELKMYQRQCQVKIYFFIVQLILLTLICINDDSIGIRTRKCILYCMCKFPSRFLLVNIP